MKAKLIITLLTMLSFFQTKDVKSQSFSVPHDSIFVSGNGQFNLYNHITNLLDTAIKVKWRVVDHDFTAEWGNELSVCDNNLCYYNINNYLLNGTINTTNPIDSGTTATFYVGYDLTNLSPGQHFLNMELSHGSFTKNTIFTVHRYSTGLTEVEKLNSTLTIFPNPARTELNTFINSKGANRISIYNLQGQLLSAQLVSTGLSKVDVSALSQGLYLMVLEDKSGNILSKARFSKE